MATLLGIIFSPLTCLLWIIVGGIAGSLAHQLVGRGRSDGFLPDVILGLIGAVVGGVLLNLIGIGFRGGSIYNPIACIGHLVVATIGASVLILIGRLISEQRTA
ncbi:MAG TPA: GlsB/YeaQ/YmgE family stress response membrane protein [Aggregatilineales bacterium]|nr:GlsB/YeaQ/YmgE family stress response membrane protein [Aggregatilineales bacterium]